MPNPINHRAAKRDREKKLTARRAEKAVRRANPRDLRHENRFPAADDTIAEGVARILSSGLE